MANGTTWLIDGHNLMHAIPWLAKSYASDRAGTINRLCDLVGILSAKSRTSAIVVFDGFPIKIIHKPPNLSVVFSREKQADVLIRRRLKKSANRNWVLVSADGELVSAARLVGTKTEKPTVFASKLNLHSPGKNSGKSGKRKGSIPFEPEIDQAEVKQLLQWFKLKDS